MSDLSWTNVTVKLSDLIPWGNNPKTSTGKNAQQLQTSHDELGQFQTVAIEPTGKPNVYQVADGHQRLSAWLAKYGKAAEIDARLASRPLTETERRKIAIYSRQIGAWDWDVLSGWEPDELTGWGFDVDLLNDWRRDVAALGNFLESEEEQAQGDAEPQTNRAEELREEWGVELGQMWRLPSRVAGQEHRLICGDCTDGVVVSKAMGGDVADMVSIDPPYGIGYNRHIPKQKHNDLENDEAPKPDVLLSQVPNAAAWYVWSRWDVLKVWIDSIPLDVRNVIVWDKLTNGMGDLQTTFAPSWEACIFASTSGHKLRGNRDRDVWQAQRPDTNEHLTPKPLELIEKCIKKSTDKMGVVYDGFSGSGTTIIAAENLARQCRAVEISPGYVAVALQRYLDAFGIRAELVE